MKTFGIKSIIIATVIYSSLILLIYRYGFDKNKSPVGYAIFFAIFMLIQAFFYFNIIKVYSDKICFRYFNPFQRNSSFKFEDIQEVLIERDQNRWSSESVTITTMDSKKTIITLKAFNDMIKLHKLLLVKGVNVTIRGFKKKYPWDKDYYMDDEGRV